MIFVTDMLERMALFYIVHIIYPAIRMAEIFLGKDLLDEQENDDPVNKTKYK